MINKLTLKRVNSAKDNLYRYDFDVYIDDVAFVERIVNFNHQQLNNKSCRKENFQSGLHWHEQLQVLLNYNHQCILLECECGDSDCGSVLVSLVDCGQYIIWQNLAENPFSYVDKNDARYKNYEHFDVFTFDRQQYISEVEKALNTEKPDKDNWVKSTPS